MVALESVAVLQKVNAADLIDFAISRDFGVQFIRGNAMIDSILLDRLLGDFALEGAND